MTFTPKFATLVDVFHHAAKAHGPNPLFGVKRAGRFEWSTYRDFAEAVREVRAGLAARGVEPGDRVAVISDNRPEWAEGAYATYTRGAAYVPMYESQRPKDWEFILRDCGARLVIAADVEIARALLELRGRLPELREIVLLDGALEGTLRWGELRDLGRRAPVEAARPAPDDVCGLIYTSGTTGNPKGVRLSHANIASNVSAIHDIFPMSPEDRSLSFLPWAHSFGQTVELHTLLSMGASMGIAESRETIVENLAEVEPTLLFSVPTIFNRIYDGLQKRMAAEGGLRKALFERAMSNEDHRRTLAASKRSSGWADLQHRLFDRLVFSKVRARFGGRLRYAFSGGAALSRQVAEFIDSLGITVYEGYGLTETSPIATANWPGARKIGSVGKPIPGVTIEVDTSATGDSKNGEIIVRGPNVMLGYHGLPEENAKVFTEDGGFRTGDMGYVDEQGYLFVTGRIKEQYKLLNGKFVVPAVLEEHLKLSPFIVNAFVDGQNQPFNVALIVPDVDAIEAWAKERGVPGSGRALLDRPEVREKIEAEIAERSGEFKSYERVRRFAFPDEDFTLENDMLTPSLKLKRRVVKARYGDLLDRLYREAARSAA